MNLNDFFVLKDQTKALARYAALFVEEFEEAGFSREEAIEIFKMVIYNSPKG